MKKKIVLLVTVIFLTGIVFLHPGCKEAEVIIDTGFIGKVWELQHIYYSGIEGKLLHGNFWIRFNDDVTFNMGADCNDCSGSYNLGTNGEISFPNSFVCTEVACGPGSGDTEFKAALSRTVRFQYDSDNGQYLLLFFIDDGNWLYFEQQNLLNVK